MADDIDLLKLILSDVAAFNTQFVLAKADGKLNWSEAYGLVLYARDLAVAEAAKLTALSGEQKKAAVVAALNTLYDQFVAPMDLVPYVPESVESRTIDPLLKSMLPGLVEAAYQIFRIQSAA